MKKIRFITLALVVAVMLMGAGYAYWTQTLTISNTVTTGNLDVDFTAASVSNVSAYMDDTASGAQVSPTDNNIINVTLAEMYPGASTTINFTLKNSGTMAAKINGFAVPAFTTKDYFQCTGYKVGSKVVNYSTPVTLDALATALTGENARLEPQGTQTYAITLQIVPTATNTQILENLKGSSAIQFSMTAKAKQFNDASTN